MNWYQSINNWDKCSLYYLPLHLITMASLGVTKEEQTEFLELLTLWPIKSSTDDCNQSELTRRFNVVDEVESSKIHLLASEIKSILNVATETKSTNPGHVYQVLNGRFNPRRCPDAAQENAPGGSHGVNDDPDNDSKVNANTDDDSEVGADTVMIHRPAQRTSIKNKVTMPLMPTWPLSLSTNTTRTVISGRCMYTCLHLIPVSLLS